MSWREIFRISLESLNSQKVRALLTILGMVIGVAAVVLLVSIGNGAKLFVTQQLEGLGTNFIVIQPGKTDRKTSLGPPIGTAQRKMTLADVTALEKKSFNLEAVTGLVLGTTTVRFEEYSANVSVFGTNESFLKIFNLKVGLGQFFSREEDDYGRRVVVLGSKVADDLFGAGSALGRQVKLNQREFKVIGIMQPTGSKLGLNLDDFVFIPTTAALRTFNEDKLFGIRAKARSRIALEDAVEEVRSILKERRDGEEDFTIATQKEMMETLDLILSMLTYVLTGIATISMIVGGIGIMNIMLVNVTERTSEIGIRRAVGARRSDILKQFLAESATLSFLGGFVGLSLAFLVTYGSYFFYPSFDMRPPSWILAPAFLLSVLVGIIFGVWPALKASKIETLEALRHE
jgi:putative ABC transport system permease protein